MLDGGNANYKDSMRRAEKLANHGVLNGQGFGPVHAYEPGLWAPAATAGLLAQNGRRQNGHGWNSVGGPHGENHA